jgi:AcrR family transcriptional regulator
MSDRPTRPRIEGKREQEIFGTAVGLIGEVGYDRVTFDEIAARAGASKASLYRRWGDKAALIDAAIETQSAIDLEVPDTGSAVGDLTALCASPEFFDVSRAAIISGLATALHREPHQHDAVRRRLVHDGTKHVRAVLARAVDRGELADDLDIDLVSVVIPAMVLFQMTYRTPGTFDEDFVSRIVTQIVNPVLEQHNQRSNHGSSDRR